MKSSHIISYLKYIEMASLPSVVIFLSLFHLLCLLLKNVQFFHHSLGETFIIIIVPFFSTFFLFVSSVLLNLKNSPLCFAYTNKNNLNTYINDIQPKSLCLTQFEVLNFYYNIFNSGILSHYCVKNCQNK